ncbi:MAG: FimV family protein, partial [Parahaliea sp.]
MARKQKLAAVLFSLGCLQSGSIWALGLGDITLESFLNEPLKARVDLLNTQGLLEDQIRVRLATSDDFDRMGVDRAYFLTGIKFEVQVSDKGTGHIILSSEDPVLEPYLDLIIETRWPNGRLLREYVVLVDPPAFDDGATVVSASQRIEQVEGIPDPTKKNSEDDEEGGDGRGRIEVGRQSDLAAGNMPRRQFGADATGQPAPGSRYLVPRDETLWRIAQQARPEGTSVHQTMLDIQRLNPDAFIDGNINRLKAGYVIYLPAEGDISSADMTQALAAIRQQNQDWREGRASSSASADAGTGVTSGGPSLRISADEEGADGGSPALTDSATLERLEQSTLENTELQARVEALGEQVRTLENIVSVKDEQIAALQRALREAGIAAPGNTGLGGTAAGVDKDSTGSAAGRQLAAADSGAKPPATAVDGPDKPEAVKPAPRPAAKPAASSPESLLDKWLYPGLGVLAALLAGGVLVWRRRQSEADASDEDSDVFAGVELNRRDIQLDDEPGGDTGRDHAELPASRGYGQRKHDEYASDIDTGDALAEADIYIAYGRYP